MSFSQILAAWPWFAGYVLVASAIFIWLRRSSSTDQFAAEAVHKQKGFGPPVTLGEVAKEFFSFTCPRLLSVVLVGLIGCRIWAGSWNLWDLAVVAGVCLFWPVQEWLIHVFLLHLKPWKMFGRTFDAVISRNHRNHHSNPWVPELGITPPHIIWLYAAGLPGVWFLALPPAQALTGIAVYFALVLNYEWMHYLIHTSYAPKTRLYKRLWRNHRLHHFQNENYWYGVTMLSGDWIFRTQPPSNKTDRSETVLTLGVARDDGQEAVGPTPVAAAQNAAH